jgi:hypothetical protein
VSAAHALPQRSHVGTLAVARATGNGPIRPKALADPVPLKPLADKMQPKRRAHDFLSRLAISPKPAREADAPSP